MGPLPEEVLSERNECLSGPLTSANYLEKLFLLTEWEQHTHMEALERYVDTVCMVYTVSNSKCMQFQFL